MPTENEVKKAKWVERVSPMGKPSHPFVAFFRALYLVGRKSVEPFIHAWRGFKYAYRKERGMEEPFKYISPTPNPVLDRMREVGIEGDAPGETTQDIPELFLYRTESGQLVSKTMINAGYLKGGHKLSAATTVTDEEADELLTQLDALILEVNLTDDEKTLREELRRHRDAKYAY